MIVVIDPPGYYLWDFAGVDGLQAARYLFGEAVSQLAAFQSLEASFDAHGCSVLRLAENNFRAALSRDHSLALALEDTDFKVWVRHCNPFQKASWIRQASTAGDRMAVLMVPEALGQVHLPTLATTKPVYSISDLPLHQAAPARIGETAVLIWHHIWLGHARFDLHTAQADAQSIAEAITVEIESHSLSTSAGRGTTAATRGYYSAL
jgi:hypothetical protein